MPSAAATAMPATRGDSGRAAVVGEQGDDDRPEHGHLALGEVEDPAEPVDERQPDPEQPELQPEHDPIEDHRPHRPDRPASSAELERWPMRLRDQPLSAPAAALLPSSTGAAVPRNAHAIPK